MKLKKIAALTALALVPGISSATVGYFAHGYGMKSIGMGGVGIALPQDGLAAASNPAGMAWVGDRYDIGLSLFRPDRSATIVGSGAPVNATYDGNGEENFFIPEFGYNRMLNPNLSLGVSVYGNGGMNTTYDSGIPLFGTGRAGVDLSQLFIAPTVGYKLNAGNSVGISLNVAYQRFKAEGLQNFDQGAFTSAVGSVTNNGYDASTGFGVRLGWLGELAPGIKLGATWQSKTDMDEFDKYRGLFAENGDFDIPENYGVGVSFEAGSGVTIAADVMEIKYSGIAAIANSGANQAQLGSANGPGFGWKDMTVFKLGVAYAMSGTTTLRAGYATGSQPIPANETFFNILAPGVVEDHLTLGATFTLEDRSAVTVGYMHAFEKTVSGVNSIAPGFGGGNANLTMSQDAIGVAYSRQLK
jgi:long-chain fatty acid transport protein